MKNIMVKDLIREVHEELIESQVERESENQKPLFIVDELTIEANFIVADDQGASNEILGRAIDPPPESLSKGLMPCDNLNTETVE